MARRLAKRFGLTKPPEKLRLNEFGEYISKYGDWLPNANETVYVRDRKIWEEQMANLRQQYADEHYSKFSQRLAEYTRLADNAMYNESLKRAQKQERRRLRNIRLGALSAANEATKSRMRMDQERVRNMINYDTIDQRRDVIREMIYEKPSENWISKENFNEKFHEKFLQCLNNNENIDKTLLTDYGLPDVGEYDTLEGLFRWSDIYFSNKNGRNNIDNIDDRLKYTRVGKQAIPMYKRIDDSGDEYVKEHVPWTRDDYPKYVPDSIEYERQDGNLMPNYWYELDFDSAFYQRQKNGEFDKSPVFSKKGTKLLYYQFDNIFEDFRLLSNEKYWYLLKNYPNMKENDIMFMLHEIMDPIVSNIANDLTNVNKEGKENKNNKKEMEQDYITGAVEDMIMSDLKLKQFERQVEVYKWRLYKDFCNRINHFRDIATFLSKMSFDSGIRRWRKEIIKWRYMIFNDKWQHLEWRQKYRSPNLERLTLDEHKLLDKARLAMKQLENLIIARRQGIYTIEKLIKQLENDNENKDILKIWYIWLEDLCENGEQIVMGKGWSYNGYKERQLVNRGKPKQVPIEYYNLPDRIGDTNVSVQVSH